MLGGPLRASRASGAAASGGAELALRLKEAVTTTVGLFPSTSTATTRCSALPQWGFSAWAVWRTSRPGDRRVARIAAPGGGLLFLVRAAAGRVRARARRHRSVRGGGFVLAFDRRGRRRGRDAVLMVVVALPLVWVFQYSGWSGTAVGWAATSSPPVLVLAAVGDRGVGPARSLGPGTLLVGAQRRASRSSGSPGCRYRTHEVGRAADEVAAIDGPVVSIRGLLAP